jgi:CDP-4-dehydro-6-deoxyglucose reductase, E1
MVQSNWPLMDDAITQEDREALAEFVLTTDKFTQGAKVKEFEAAWNDWLGSYYSVFVSSGSTANLLLVSAIMERYDLKRGDKVLLPACTWVTNVSPIIQLGLTPIFCDINLKNFSFDLDSMRLVKESHPDIKMIFVTHLLGFPAQNDEYRKIFPEALIIDDACESHGVVMDGEMVGSVDLAATFSFYFGHHMTTVEGGMISTYDTGLYDLLRIKRSHGLARESVFFNNYVLEYTKINPEFLFLTDGFNFRNTEFAAVLGLSQLPRLDNMITQRNQNFKRFEYIVSQYEDKFYPIHYVNGMSSFSLPFIAKDKFKLARKLSLAGIEHRPIVAGNLLRQPFLAGHKLYSVYKKPKADILNDSGLYIGNSHFVGDEQFELLEGVLKEL